MPCSGLEGAAAAKSLNVRAHDRSHICAFRQVLSRRAQMTLTTGPVDENRHCTRVPARRELSGEPKHRQGGSMCEITNVPHHHRDRRCATSPGSEGGMRVFDALRVFNVTITRGLFFFPHFFRTFFGFFCCRFLNEETSHPGDY